MSNSLRSSQSVGKLKKHNNAVSPDGIGYLLVWMEIATLALHFVLPQRANDQNNLVGGDA
jgi:hypothetical protein